jgi:hypothetical protein
MVELNRRKRRNKRKPIASTCPGSCYSLPSPIHSVEQRNVGILEKIAEQLLTTTSIQKKMQRDELEQQ